MSSPDAGLLPGGAALSTMRLTVEVSGGPVQDDALAAPYRGYIARLNTRRFDELHEFVHDELVHNDRELSRADYQAMLASHASAIPGLHYDVVSLLASDDEVAARIHFRCTPVQEWLGFTPPS
jgi:predicted ester cyclase